VSAELIWWNSAGSYLRAEWNPIPVSERLPPAILENPIRGRRKRRSRQMTPSEKCLAAKAVVGRFSDARGRDNGFAQISITNAFRQHVIPQIDPSPEEIEQALTILEWN